MAPAYLANHQKQSNLTENAQHLLLSLIVRQILMLSLIHRIVKHQHKETYSLAYLQQQVELQTLEELLKAQILIADNLMELDVLDALIDIMLALRTDVFQ